MVSALTSRLFASSDDSNSGSSKSSGHKRQLKGTGPGNSVSGYSADREESSTSPSVGSVVLGSGGINKRDLSFCSKRQRRDELQFVASSVRADLERAGIEFPIVNPAIENTTSSSIHLNSVELVHSKAFSKGPAITTNASTASQYDYQALALACWGSYPNNLSRPERAAKVFPSSQDSDRSTSSVSDTDSDSGDSRGNGNQTIIISPLLEDGLEANQRRSVMIEDSCNVISSSNHALTMSEILSLSKFPRVVAMSSYPSSIVYANAAFLRFSGLAADKVVGSPFASILDGGSSHHQRQHYHYGGQQLPSLPECMVSSSSGNHKKLDVRSSLAQDTPHKNSTPATSNSSSIPCYAKVSPIVAHKPKNSEVTKVTHFAVEFRGEHDAFGDSGAGAIQRSLLTTPGDTAVGVMG